MPDAPAPTELLPCPFCGSTKVGIAASQDMVDGKYIEEGRDWSVLCDGCGASCSTSLSSEKEAVKMWNLRQAASVERAEPCAGDTNEYQPRSAFRLVELLRSFGYGPRSWQSEAADMIERLTFAPAQTVMDRDTIATLTKQVLFYQEHFDARADLVAQWRAEAKRHRTAEYANQQCDDEYFLHKTEADRLEKCVTELEAATPSVPSAQLGCGDPNCKDPNCGYGK